MSVIAIIGSRRRNSMSDCAKIELQLGKIYQEGDTIVSGGCPKGGDYFAECLAKKHGLTITIHYPDWKKYGRGAGFVRNTKIANDANKLIACVAADRTGGTEDTIKKFIKKHCERLDPPDVIKELLFFV